MNYLKFILLLTIFLPQMVFSNDGRPEYMMQENGCSIIYGEKITHHGFDAKIIPVASPSNKNLNDQKDFIESYVKNQNIAFLENLTKIQVFSRPQEKNPDVILFIHGSGGGSEVYSLPIEDILDRGFALVNVNRFISYIAYPTCKSYNNITEKPFTVQKDGSQICQDANSWNKQDSFSMMKEVVMIHNMCLELQNRGTQNIILAGHSRGGTLVCRCAQTDISDLFEKAGVKRYVAFGALPIHMRPLQQTLPFSFVTGEYDTICAPDLIEAYRDEFFKEQDNVSVQIVKDMGHHPFVVSPRPTFFRNTVQLFYNVFVLTYAYFWGDYLTYETRPDAQSFVDACCAVGDSTFRPLVTSAKGYIFGEEQSLDGYSKFLENNMKIGVIDTEKWRTKAEQDAINAQNLDTLCPLS